jgi:hypothetical protein
MLNSQLWQSAVWLSSQKQLLPSLQHLPLLVAHPPFVVPLFAPYEQEQVVVVPWVHWIAKHAHTVPVEGKAGSAQHTAGTGEF